MINDVLDLRVSGLEGLHLNSPSEIYQDPKRRLLWIQRRIIGVARY